jgi:hypothetical protein
MDTVVIWCGRLVPQPTLNESLITTVSIEWDTEDTVWERVEVQFFHTMSSVSHSMDTVVINVSLRVG